MIRFDLTDYAILKVALTEGTEVAWISHCMAPMLWGGGYVGNLIGLISWLSYCMASMLGGEGYVGNLIDFIGWLSYCTAP